MKNITFVSPSMNFRRSMGVYAPLMEAAPPIGLARLAAVCRLSGLNAAIVDAYSERLSPAQTIDRAAAADVIAVSCLTPSAGFVDSVLRLARDRCPNAKIVLGNIHAGIFAADYIDTGLADAVVRGEGERVLPALISKWAAGEPIDESIPGVTFAAGGRRVSNPPPAPIQDLDSLPIPAWELTPYHLYGLLPFVTMAKPAFTVEGSRGCPYNCFFCSLGETGKKYRKFSAARIVDEFEALIDRFGAHQIAFADAMFPLTEDQGIEFCETLMKTIPASKRVVWTTETRTDALTPRLVAAMKAAGCGRILLGIESGSNETLNSVNKKLSVEKTRAAVDACRAAGIQTCGFFMLGLPGETAAAAEKTISFARELPLDVAKFNIAIPYPGSRFFDELDAAGALKHKKWEDYTCYVSDPDQLPWVNPEWEPAELINLQNRALRKFYLRPAMILRHLLVIRSVSPRLLIVGGWILILSIFRDLRRR